MRPEKLRPLLESQKPVLPAWALVVIAVVAVVISTAWWALVIRAVWRLGS